MEKFECGKVDGKGVGVFSLTKLKKGSEVMEFSGPIIDLEYIKENSVDRYVQIGKDSFMGPSGGFDDFVNHSCDPNAALLLDPPRLVAIKEIDVYDEITFDYSMTSTEYFDTWEMICNCGSPKCRNRISGFLSVPEETRRRKMLDGIVPRYVIEATSSRIA
jgi:SET domain-containing protein